MKKALVIIVAILVMVAITGCSNATTSTSTIPTTTATTATTNTTTNHTAAPANDENNVTPDVPENPVEDNNEPENTTVDSTTDNDEIDSYKSYFLQEKAGLERCMQTMVDRGQYESFEARDFSRYGIWEYEPWHWTDHYNSEYQWPVLLNSGEKDEILFVEDENGHLIQITCWGDMLRKMDLGSLYE